MLRSAGPAAVLAVAAALGLLGGWLAQRRAAGLEDDIRAQWVNRLETGANAMRLATTAWLRERRGDTRIVAYEAAQEQSMLVARTRAESPAARERGAEVDSLLSRMRREYGYTAIWIVDRAGRVLARTPKGGTPSARELRDAAAVAASGVERIVGPFRSAGDSLRLAFLAPIVRHEPSRTGAPDVSGVVILLVDPGEQLIPIALGEQAQIAGASRAIVLPMGDSAAVARRSPSEQDAAPIHLDVLARPLPLALSLAGHDTSAIIGSDTAHAMIAAVQRVPGTDWSVIRGIDAAVASAAVRRQLRNDALAALVIFVLAAIGATAFGHAARSLRIRTLAESEARYRLLAEHSTDLISRHTPDGRYLYVSPAIRVLTGYEARELIGRSPFEYIHPDDEPIVREAMRDMLMGVRRGSTRFRLRHKDGSLVWLDTRGRAVVGDDGAVQEFVTVSRDVTDRKASEDVVRRQALLFETLYDGVLLLDEDFTVLDGNPSAERIFGFSRAELIGRPMAMLRHPDERDETEADMRALLEREGRWQGEIRFQRKDGTSGVADVVVVRLLDSAGKFTGMMAISRDITRRRQMEAALRHSEERLRQAQKMEAIGRLAGGIAHDFNNLLTAITSNAEFALSALPARSAQRAEVDEIRRAADRAAALTRQLLAFSRRQVLQPKVLDLNAIIADAERMFRRLIGEHIQLSTILDPSAGLVTADPGQLEQVLLNLVVNARDAMTDGGTLTIETAGLTVDAANVPRFPGLDAGTYARLRVRDTGIGMTDEVRQHIFEPFFTSKPTGQGTGLGLSTAYGIVRQSGGHIYVDSAPGFGTVFTVFFPRSTRPAPLPDDGQRHQGNGSLGSETVLLVEDEDAVRAPVRRMLERHGYAVIEARDGEEALRRYEEAGGRVDLLVTDVVMPGMGGPELVSRIRTRQAGVRVLFMSGYTEEAITTHGVIAAGAGFIGKPFTIDQFASRVRELLDAATPTA